MVNLLDELTAILSPNDKAVARITGKKAEGIWIATILAGATVILTGQGEIGKQVYYNRATGAVLGWLLR